MHPLRPVLLYTVHYCDSIFYFKLRMSRSKCKSRGDTVVTAEKHQVRRRKWQPTPVILQGKWTEEPGRLQAVGSQESDTT